MLAFSFLGVSVLLSLGALSMVAASGTVSTRRSPGPGALNAAKIAFSDRNYVEAEILLREILKSEPGQTPGRVLLGRVLLERGRAAEAREIFAALVKEDAKHSESLRGLGAAYRGLGQLELAVVFLGQAAELEKTNPLLWKELGFAQREKGDPFAALASFQQSLSLDKSQADISNLLAELATGKPGHSGGEVSRGGQVDPYSPRLIDPESLVPKPRVPDPSRHFPTPGGRPR